MRTDQPFRTLASHLLEPASEDGVVAWNFVDRLLTLRAPYPIARARTAARSDNGTALTQARSKCSKKEESAEVLAAIRHRQDDIPR